MSLALGSFRVHEIRDGTFALDGGAMFGVVPRPLWEKKLAPDERHRVRLALRCLLIEVEDRRILVDDGIGSEWSDKHRDQYGINQSDYDLDRELARAGCTREQVTDVVLTHLHFDHAGGTVRREKGELQLAFPNATFHLQRRNWEWAHNASERDRGSFRGDTFALLKASGRLNLLDGPTELIDGFELFLSEGHTVGLQLPRLQGDGRELVYCGDLIPTTAHLKPSWNMAYDLHPLTVVEEKKALLAEAVEEGWILFFEHDPDIAACTVREDRGEIVVDQVVSF